MNEGHHPRVGDSHQFSDDGAAESRYKIGLGDSVTDI
jgi:hypothetical protein